jgi:hypothetical protein
MSDKIESRWLEASLGLGGHEEVTFFLLCVPFSHCAVIGTDLEVKSFICPHAIKKYCVRVLSDLSENNLKGLGILLKC